MHLCLFVLKQLNYNFYLFLSLFLFYFIVELFSLVTTWFINLTTALYLFILSLSLPILVKAKNTKHDIKVVFRKFFNIVLQYINDKYKSKKYYDAISLVMYCLIVMMSQLNNVAMCASTNNAFPVYKKVEFVDTVLYKIYVIIFNLTYASFCVALSGVVVFFLLGYSLFDLGNTEYDNENLEKLGDKVILFIFLWFIIGIIFYFGIFHLLLYLHRYTWLQPVYVLVANAIYVVLFGFFCILYWFILGTCCFMVFLYYCVNRYEFPPTYEPELIDDLLDWTMLCSIPLLYISTTRLVLYLVCLL